MPTSNIQVTTAWTKLADDTNTNVLATWENPVAVEIATTAANTAPTVIGHMLDNESAVSRGAIGPGFVWAKLRGATPGSINVVVSK